MRTKYVVLTFLLAVLGIGYFWPSKIELNEHEYEIAIALYRVCNQKSEEGLAKIEELIAQDKGEDEYEKDSSLMPIIAWARSGDWEIALVSCREILDDQVKSN